MRRSSHPGARPEGCGFPENTFKTRTHHPGKVSERLDKLQVALYQPRHPEPRLPPTCASGTPGKPPPPVPAPPTHLDVSGERGRGPEESQEQQERRAHRHRHHPPPPERNCGRNAPAGTRLARPRPPPRVTAPRANQKVACSRTPAPLSANGTRRKADGAALRREMAAGPDGSREGAKAGVGCDCSLSPLAPQAAAESAPR